MLRRGNVGILRCTTFGEEDQIIETDERMNALVETSVDQIWAELRQYSKDIIRIGDGGILPTELDEYLVKVAFQQVAAELFLRKLSE